MTHTVHFPPAIPPQTPQTEQAPRSSALSAYLDALRDADLVRSKLRGLVNAGASRHGDLQVALSAVLRTEQNVRALIGAEGTA